MSGHTPRWLGSCRPEIAAVATVGSNRGSGRICSEAVHDAGASGEHESMKSRETLIRLKKFQVDEKRRKVAQIEGMIA